MYEEAMQLWVDYLKIFPRQSKGAFGIMLFTLGLSATIKMLRLAIKHKKRIIITDAGETDINGCYIEGLPFTDEE